MHETKTPQLEALIQTVHRLRAPDGCPWDREQTHQSLRPYLIEEAYEVLDVLDRMDRDDRVTEPEIRDTLCEELGDLLLQVLLHAEMASEKGAFTMEDVARALNEKLIRRHPHVFADEKADSADSAYKNWEKQKAKEKKSKTGTVGVLDGLPKALPALQRGARVIEKVTKVGFQWKDLKGPLAKIDEEVRELREATEAYERDRAEDMRKKVEAELGDALFTLCNLGHLLGVSPEDALRSTLQRFETRFRHVEKRLHEQGRSPEQSSLDEMDRYWDEAKRIEREKN